MFLWNNMIQHAACFTEHKRDRRRKCDSKGVQWVRIVDPKANKNLQGGCLKGKRSKQCKSIRVEEESSEGKHAEKNRESPVTLNNTTDSKWKKCDFWFYHFREKLFKKVWYKNLFKDIWRSSKIFPDEGHYHMSLQCSVTLGLWIMEMS